MNEMIIGVTNGTGEAKCIADHTETVVLGFQGSVDGIFVDHPLASLDGAPEVPVVNTCVAVRNAMLSEPLQKGLMEAWKVQPGKMKSSFFSLFNGREFGDWLEVGFSGRFMTGNVGPNLGFIHGAGIRVQNLEEALPNLSIIQQTLVDMGYQGEVLLYVDDLFRVVSVQFGHYYAHWAMYGELCKSSSAEMLGYLFGTSQKCELYESVCVANLVTLYPFPSLGLQVQGIHAPKNAEKHLWRVPFGSSEKVLVTVHGDNVHEARRRVRRTIENILQSSPDIQYRIDYGFGLDFVLAKEQYKKLCERPGYEGRSTSVRTNGNGKVGAGISSADSGAGNMPSSGDKASGNLTDISALETETSHTD